MDQVRHPSACIDGANNLGLFSVTPPRYWLALHPDLTHPVGGVKQMHRLAETLTSLGREAVIIQADAGFHPGWFKSSVSTIAYREWNALSGKERDIVVLPETYIRAFGHYCPGARKVIFNQNFHYTFDAGRRDSLSVSPSAGPPISSTIRLYRRHKELVHVLCVSNYDALSLISGLGIHPGKVSTFPNCIDASIFVPSHKEDLIAYMPRKNAGDVEIVLTMLRSRPGLSGWSFQPIDGCSEAEVGNIFRRAKVFLSFGFPEGFGLPVAEAMASGCYCIGYSGLGGRELFALAQALEAGQSVEFGDWYGFVASFEDYLAQMRIDESEIQSRQLALSRQVLKRYSSSRQKLALQSALLKIEQYSFRSDSHPS